MYNTQLEALLKTCQKVQKIILTVNRTEHNNILFKQLIISGGENAAVSKRNKPEESKAVASGRHQDAFLRFQVGTLVVKLIAFCCKFTSPKTSKNNKYTYTCQASGMGCRPYRVILCQHQLLAITWLLARIIYQMASLTTVGRWKKHWLKVTNPMSCSSLCHLAVPLLGPLARYLVNFISPKIPLNVRCAIISCH